MRFLDEADPDSFGANDYGGRDAFAENSSEGRHEADPGEGADRTPSEPLEFDPGRAFPLPDLTPTLIGEQVRQIEYDLGNYAEGARFLDFYLRGEAGVSLEAVAAGYGFSLTVAWFFDESGQAGFKVGGNVLLGGAAVGVPLSSIAATPVGKLNRSRSRARTGFELGKMYEIAFGPGKVSGEDPSDLLRGIGELELGPERAGYGGAGGYGANLTWVVHETPVQMLDFRFPIPTPIERRYDVDTLFRVP